MVDQGPVQREDEDDHDLLTYGEVGFRLYRSVQQQVALVDELQRTGSTDLPLAQERLFALEEAVDRNRRQPINDENFERFFGYSGVAKRNT